MTPPALTLALLISIVLLGAHPSAASDVFPGENPNHPMYGDSRGPLVDKVETITLRSSSGPGLAREIVEAQGKDYIRLHVAKELEVVRAGSESVPDFEERAIRQLDTLKDWDSEMYAYLEELARQTNLPLEELWLSLYVDSAWVASMSGLIEAVWNGKKELYMAASRAGIQGRGGCTTMGWANGVIGGNMDFTSTFLGAQKNTKTPNLIFEGEYFGAYRAMGRNVGLIITTIVPDSVAAGPDGLPHPIVIASVAERAKSVAHAIELLDKIKFESPMSYLLADKDGGLMVYYAVEGDRMVNLPTEGRIAQTNFSIQKRDRLLQAWDGDYLKVNEHLMQALYRYDTSMVLLRGVPLDERNVDAMKTLLRTQPIQMRSARGADFGTVASYVMDLPNGCMYQTPDRPDLSEYIKVCFDKE